MHARIYIYIYVCVFICSGSINMCFVVIVCIDSSKKLLQGPSLPTMPAYFSIYIAP